MHWKDAPPQVKSRPVYCMWENSAHRCWNLIANMYCSLAKDQQSRVAQYSETVWEDGTVEQYRTVIQNGLLNKCRSLNGIERSHPFPGPWNHLEKVFPWKAEMQSACAFSTKVKQSQNVCSSVLKEHPTLQRTQHSLRAHSAVLFWIFANFLSKHYSKSCSMKQHIYAAPMLSSLWTNQHWSTHHQQY